MTLEEVDLVRRNNFGYQKIFANQRELYWKNYDHSVRQTSQRSDLEPSYAKEPLASRLKRKLRANRIVYRLWVGVRTILQEIRLGKTGSLGNAAVGNGPKRGWHRVRSPLRKSTAS